MKPAGVILTYMGQEDFIGKTFWVKLRTAFFNCKLFVGQLAFMIVGTAIGKVKQKAETVIYIDVIIIAIIAGIIAFIPRWWNIPIIIVVGIAMIRGIEWRQVWRAAQCSHVRLCLRQVVEVFPTWEYISFSHPVAKMDYWTMTMVAHERFRYFDPTFETSDRFIEAMIEYAEKQVGKGYDTLQLFSYGLNFIVWLFWPPWWGQEKLKWLNLRGGREVCSSGVTACLRYAELIASHNIIASPEKFRMLQKLDKIYGYSFFTQFFNDYDTAVIPPCLVPLSENWEGVQQ